MAKSGNIGHFLMLTRPSNMLVIVLTMYIVKLYVFGYWIQERVAETTDGTWVMSANTRYPDTFELDFFLLVWSTLLLAAAGNIINDYFDVRADRINRPNRILIGRYVKKRWAIVTHWAFNATGVLIAAWLAYKYQSYWLIVIPFASSVFLWIYSTYLKRKILFGNIVIAALTGLVVVLPAHFILNAMGGSPLPLANTSIDLKPALVMTALLTFFAFITNFTREIVKDLHDVPGDLKIGCETIPIVMGNRFTRIIIGALLGLQLMFFVLIITVGASKLETGSEKALPALVLGLLITIGYFIAFMLNIFSKTSEQHYRISGILKIIMLLGILFPLLQLL